MIFLQNATIIKVMISLFSLFNIIMIKIIKIYLFSIILYKFDLIFNGLWCCISATMSIIMIDNKKWN